jgi:hypothetical protein
LCPNEQQSRQKLAQLRPRGDRLPHPCPFPAEYRRRGESEGRFR